MSITTRERVVQRLQQARSPAPRAASSGTQAGTTEAAVVPGGWFGGLLGVSSWRWNNRSNGSAGMGVTDGSEAQPGEIGEYRQTASPLGFVLPAGIWTATVSLQLPPGDWDVMGEVDMNTDGLAQQCTTRISLDAAGTAPSTLTGAMMSMQAPGGGVTHWGGNAGGNCRLLTATPLTVYGWAFCDVQASSFYFGLGARRMR